MQRKIAIPFLCHRKEEFLCWQSPCAKWDLFKRETEKEEERERGGSPATVIGGGSKGEKDPRKWIYQVLSSDLSQRCHTVPQDVSACRSCTKLNLWNHGILSGLWRTLWTIKPSVCQCWLSHGTKLPSQMRAPCLPQGFFCLFLVCSPEECWGRGEGSVMPALCGCPAEVCFRLKTNQPWRLKSAQSLCRCDLAFHMILLDKEHLSYIHRFIFMIMWLQNKLMSFLLQFKFWINM